MQRRIVGFHQDPDRHWVADLECGHAQHVRHEPPLQTRPWVLAEETRSAHLGTMLACASCEAADAAYQDARLQGLCADGASEVARRRGEP